MDGGKMTQDITQSSFNLQDYIIHHVQNSHEWNIPFWGTIPLPSFLTVHSLMVILDAIFLAVLFCFIYQKNARVPQGITNLLEAMIVFIRDEIVVPNLGQKEGRKLLPLFCTFFFFILSLNLMGLIPLFSTATANINVTGPLAVITLFFMTFGAIYKNGLKSFLKQFVPSGVPRLLLLILIPMEFIGLFVRPIALMIRLFANMFAGHIVILSLLGLVGLLGISALPSVVLAVFILVLEIFIAFLQAYIFTLLSAIFIGQAYHPQHC